MYIRESEWLGRRLASRPSHELFPMLNVGSSTEECRTIMQPWIDQNIFAPIRRRRGGLPPGHDASARVDIVGGGVAADLCWNRGRSPQLASCPIRQRGESWVQNVKRLSRTRRLSASVMRVTNCWKVVLRLQQRTCSAFDGLPHEWVTSVGR